MSVEIITVDYTENHSNSAWKSMSTIGTKRTFEPRPRWGKADIALTCRDVRF
jgi:hypothetical protein